MTNFDRTNRQEELPKLQGCFTRGTQYRWSIYETFFATVPQGARVLDVGCGSLVETHFMAKSGMRVTGIDLDSGKLEAFRERYDWTGLHPPDLRPMSLQDLARAGESFDAVTAFDVIEHLEDLEAGLRAIRAVLRPGGLVFITTPNGLSLSEIYGWLMLRTGRLMGHHPPPGVPHLQMHTPWGWRRRFEAAGFTGVGHGNRPRGKQHAGSCDGADSSCPCGPPGHPSHQSRHAAQADAPALRTFDRNVGSPACEGRR
ncbi:MAG: methyltransferase domain-containing protein [Gammaproteobacteria bacterium]|nr:methyltransferase domain-containing protein [Gammaproteobacteria bacterium]